MEKNGWWMVLMIRVIEGVVERVTENGGEGEGESVVVVVVV
jgi:hypothetical protein